MFGSPPVSFAKASLSQLEMNRWHTSDAASTIRELGKMHGNDTRLFPGVGTGSKNVSLAAKIGDCFAALLRNC